MSLFSQTFVDAFDSLRAVAGEMVRFGCPHGELTLEMVPGRSELEQEDGPGVMRWEAHDFLVPAAELVFDGRRYEPRSGDWIVFNGRRFEALPDNVQPCFRYTDTAHELMRIHTKHVGEECDQ